MVKYSSLINAEVGLFRDVANCRHDYRLQYYNLKKARSQNALALDEIYKLWIPFLVFTNTEKNEATMGTEDTEVTITRWLSDLQICSSIIFSFPWGKHLLAC